MFYGNLYRRETVCHVHFNLCDAIPCGGVVIFIFTHSHAFFTESDVSCFDQCFVKYGAFYLTVRIVVNIFSSRGFYFAVIPVCDSDRCLRVKQHIGASREIMGVPIDFLCFSQSFRDSPLFFSNQFLKCIQSALCISRAGCRCPCRSYRCVCIFI